ncbi:MAG TPA: beta-phosphoglucomutase family hydrolase [Planctomycetaceae bacterium]|nr:beta-phosphoglucomutase family hydrolase [Planctomycetaceae bacterium]
MLPFEPAAIIFDCDGTLADTMPAHYEAWVATMSRYAVTFDEDLFYGLGGWPTLQVAEHLLSLSKPAKPVTAEQIVVEKEALFEQSLAAIRPIAPVVEVARRHKNKLPMAVASGGLRRIVDATLNQLGIADWFQTIVTCEDVTRHKPEPDIYLEAARRLNVVPSMCLAFEDTDPGVQSAYAAGMQVVDVRSLYTPRRVTVAA